MKMSRMLTWSVFSVVFIIGCEVDELAPVSSFQPEDCLEEEDCNDQIPLDSGVRIPLDSGVQIDAGFDDAGRPVDAGFPDTGFIDSGAGFPDAGGPPPEFLNLSGTWRTRYQLDTSNYVLGIGNIAAELDFLDQAIRGNIDTGFFLLDDLIEAVIQNFIPPWVVTLTGALNDAAAFLEQMEATGTLNISQDLPVTPYHTTTAIHGSEIWHNMVVYIINSCPNGRQDHNYPHCARYLFPVATNPSSVGALEILVQVENPFHGVLQAGVPEADFTFDNRVVEADVGKLIILVLNIVTQIATNGQFNTLRDALVNAADCPGLAANASWIAEYDLGLGSILAATVYGTVYAVCEGAIDGLVDLIGTIVVGTDFFEIHHQYGHAVDSTPWDGQDRPEQLRDITTQNTIDGASLGGVWEGLP